MDKGIKGLVAAPFTPMRKDGELNCAMVGPYAEFLARNGAAGAFVCGSAGEGHSMSVEERMKAVEAWIAEAPKSLKVIVHAGANSLPDVKRLLAHASKKGAFAGALMAPCYYKPASVKDLVGFFSEAAKAAPDLPVYFYNIPVLSGVSFPMIEFLEEASERVPNLAGIKYTHEDLMDYSLCLKFRDDRHDILYGRDQMLLCALAFGAKGAVGSTFNFAAPLYLQIVESYKKGRIEKARELQEKSHRMIRALFSQGVASIPAQKGVMRELGIDCGDARPPFRKLAKEDRLRIRKALESAGFEEYRCR